MITLLDTVKIVNANRREIIVNKIDVDSYLKEDWKLADEGSTAKESTAKELTAEESAVEKLNDQNENEE